MLYLYIATRNSSILCLNVAYPYSAFTTHYLIKQLFTLPKHYKANPRFAKPYKAYAVRCVTAHHTRYISLTLVALPLLSQLDNAKPHPAKQCLYFLNLALHSLAIPLQDDAPRHRTKPYRYSTYGTEPNTAIT